jgi:hypothetical protein
MQQERLDRITGWWRPVGALSVSHSRAQDGTTVVRIRDTGFQAGNLP